MIEAESNEGHMRHRHWLNVWLLLLMEFGDDDARFYFDHCSSLSIEHESRCTNEGKTMQSDSPIILRNHET